MYLQRGTRTFKLGTVKCGLYMLNIAAADSFCGALQTQTATAKMLNARLGHCCDEVHGYIVTNRLVEGLPAKLLLESPGKNRCEACLLSKQARPKFERNHDSAAQVLELVHADVMGPCQVQSLGNSIYALVVLDDCSRYSAVTCLESKADVPCALLSILCQ